MDVEFWLGFPAAPEIVSDLGQISQGQADVHSWALSLWDVRDGMASLCFPVITGIAREFLQN